MKYRIEYPGDRLQWALDRRGLTPSEKLVLVTLVHSWQRNFGSTKITIGLICRQTGMHRASVFRALNTLEERHLITRHHDRRHGRQSPTEYVLRLEHAELELATSPEPNPQPALPLPRKPTEKQLIFITSLAAEKGLSVSMPDTWQQAMDLTDWLKAQPRRDKENPGRGRRRIHSESESESKSKLMNDRRNLLRWQAAQVAGEKSD